MIPCGTTGTLIAQNEKGIIRIGSGLDDKMREDIWSNKDSYIGKIVKYKYFSQGVKDLPRHPVFIGFRDPDDLGQ
jgi:DNA ligase-1